MSTPDRHETARADAQRMVQNGSGHDHTTVENLAECYLSLRRRIVEQCCDKCWAEFKKEMKP